MSKMLLIQTLASIGAGLGVVLTYVGLNNETQTVAAFGFALFAVSMLVTPAMRLVPKKPTATS